MQKHHISCLSSYYREDILLLPKVFTTLSVFNQCPSSINAPGAVDMSLKAPGFAILPVVHSAGHPIEHTLRDQESRWDRARKEKQERLI